MFTLQAQGYFSWIVINGKDKIVRYSPTYSPNLILDQGLNGIAVRSWADSFTACAVGVGTSTPQNNQIGLDAESKRTSTYLDFEDANTSFLSGNEFTLQRTFVFPIEGGDITYREAGFGYSLSLNSLFSRVSLPNILVSGGERLVIQYRLVIKFDVTTPRALSNPIIDTRHVSSGILQYQRVGLKGISGLGVSYDFDDAEGCNEPSTAAKAFLSVDSSAPAAFGSTVNRVGGSFEASTALSTYISNSFSRVKTFTAVKNQATGVDWRSAGLGAAGGSSYLKTGLVYVFNSIYQKSVGRLDIGYQFTWRRRYLHMEDTLYYWQCEENMALKRNQLLSYYGMNDE